MDSKLDLREMGFFLPKDGPQTSPDHTGHMSGTSKQGIPLIDTHCEPVYDVSPPSAPVSVHIQQRLEMPVQGQRPWALPLVACLLPTL